jgi:prolyl-tRNA editing enzyme YbaK/EbsC (Cys-tRNA(Pro) deacylase)
MLDQNHLLDYLRRNRIKAKLVGFKSPVMRSEEAKRLARGNVVKSILLVVDRRPVLCLLGGEDKLSFKKLRKVLGARQVRLAKAREVKCITGYDVGALPPFAHLSKLKTLVDLGVSELKGDAFVGGGSHYHLMRIDVDELLRVVKGEMVDLHE